jgi:hypothetical protein
LENETNIAPKLFPELEDADGINSGSQNKTTERLSRLDTDKELRKKILPYCRLEEGGIWEDGSGHKVGVLM